MKTYWTCTNCKDQVDEVYEVCWNCQYDREGNPSVADDERAMAMATADPIERRRVNEKYKDKYCAHCKTLLRHLGTKEFNEGRENSTLIMLLEHSVPLDVFVCPSCRRVEFFYFDPR